MHPHWRCSECDGTEVVANRERKDVGLPVLRDNALNCSPVPARGRERRLSRAKYGPGSTYRPPGLPDDWRCASCG